MFSGLMDKIRNWGVGKAIAALDLLEPILTERLNDAKKQIDEMDSKQLSVYLIDQVQDTLRKHFNIPEEKK